MENNFINNNAQVSILGAGYVGTPLALLCAKAGYTVKVYDCDTDRINILSNGKSPFNHISDQVIQTACDTGLVFTSEEDDLSGTDVFVICVPTPLDVYHQPNLSYVQAAVQAICKYIRKGCLVSLESTTYPGTTKELVVPALEALGYVVGRDVFCAYSPEREDPGNKQFETRTIPKICAGVSAACLDISASFYETLVDHVVRMSSTEAAELCKLLENIHRGVNIGLANEMKVIADRMNIDIYEVIDAAATKPFGFAAYYPGPGLGGHCIPVDPMYLSWKSREFGLNTEFIDLSAKINSSMQDYVVEKINYALNSVSLSLSAARILILGLSYKRNVSDTRESPSLGIFEKLQNSGADVYFSDPHVQLFPSGRFEANNMMSVACDAPSLNRIDCIVLLTDHDEYDYEGILNSGALIVDVRGKFPWGHPNVFRA
jgi:UDP-N-acetyl-D-glucosamine dehydrogenase